MSDEKILETKSKKKKAAEFVEGIDYYFDDGLMVLTGRFLLKRGYCCGNGCRHCPYSENAELQKENI